MSLAMTQSYLNQPGPWFALAVLSSTILVAASLALLLKKSILMGAWGISLGGIVGALISPMTATAEAAEKLAFGMIPHVGVYVLETLLLGVLWIFALVKNQNNPGAH